MEKLRYVPHSESWNKGKGRNNALLGRGKIIYCYSAIICNRPVSLHLFQWYTFTIVWCVFVLETHVCCSVCLWSRRWGSFCWAAVRKEFTPSLLLWKQSIGTTHYTLLLLLWRQHIGTSIIMETIVNAIAALVVVSSDSIFILHGGDSKF